MKKIYLTVLILGLMISIEPIFRNSLSFAFSLLGTSNSGIEQVGSYGLVETKMEVSQSDFDDHGHAPEPSTFILFLGGIAGFFVRFVRRSYNRFKRYSDIILALIGLIIASPILILAAILINLNSKGSVLYKQSRVGENGKVFRIFKLRTMRIDAEKDTGAVWAKKDDPRITSVGRLLRKIHIDEIPQLVNVLKGEMSIVGPRPERPEMVRDLKNLIVDYEKRLLIKPGITGLAQVFHKYDETIKDVKKKIKYDLLYIKKVCLWVDLKVMLQTVIVVFTGKGAQ